LAATIRRTSPVTTRDIARIVGVSQPVVSKVLNGGSGNVGASAATRARILEIAHKVGYRSNSAARAMRTGRFRCAALLLGANPSTSMLPNALFSGLLDALAKLGMHLTVAKLPDAKLVSEGVVPQLLAELFADGLLINYNARIPRGLIEMIERHHMPSVWINSIHPADCVHPDDHAAARRLTEHFIQSGHRRVAFLNSAGTWHYSAAQRRDGYVDAMGAAGLAPHVVEVRNKSTEVERGESARMLIDCPDRPTAIVCYSREGCELVCRLAEAGGISVPSDLAVGVFHDEPLRWQQQVLPTMVLPEREIAMAAVAMLLKKIAQPDEPQPPVAVPCCLGGVDRVELGSHDGLSGRRTASS
jgi:LacI family transcriptional regulator